MSVRNIIKYASFLLLLSLLSCTSNEVQDDSFFVCGTDDAPYRLADFTTDTAIYRLDYWWWLENEGMVADSAAIYKDIKKLNSVYDTANIQFELGNIFSVVAPRKFEDQKSYMKHGWELEEWYWENRDSVPYALFVMVYPPSKGVFPGAALGIGAQGYCVQSLFLNSSTSVHEMGHCFGLRHPHTKDDLPGRSFYTGDLVCLPYCEPIANRISADGKSIIDKPEYITDKEEQDIIENYMTYTRFQYRRTLTKDQIDLIKWHAVHAPSIRKARIN